MVKTEELEQFFEIFPNENDIYFSDKFANEVINRRLKRSFINKTIIKSKEVYIDIDNINKFNSGIYSTNIFNAHFKFFFHKGEEKKLIVCLNGARTSSGGIKREIPIYNRWSFYNLTNCSWISIEDPMYFKFNNLLLGWFYGDEHNDFRYYTTLLIKKIAKILDIKQNNIIFYGGSGGGTAALDIACKMGNCTAVSINGQYNFEYNHKDIANFYNITNIDLHKKDKYNRNNILKILSNNSVKYIIIENCKSKWDLRDHLSYLCKKFNIAPRLGISKFNNIYLYIYEANGKSPHTSFEDRALFYVIYFIINIARHDLEIEKYKKLFLLFNEFWYYKYQTEDVISVNYIKDENFIPENKKIFNKISIDTKTDKYCNFNFYLECNKKYNIKIYGIKIFPYEKNITIGIYSKILHDFIFSDIKNIESKFLNIFFYIKGEARDLKFCIFSGIHGKTQNKNLYIEKIELYQSKLK